MSRSPNRICELPEVRWDTGGTEPEGNYPLSHVENGKKIINYGRDPLYVTGYPIKW